MGILETLLSELPELDLTTKVRIICDKILEEETSNIKHPDLLPTGARIFLSLEVPGRNNNEVGFLSLEREDEEVYVIIYSTLEKHRISDDPENKITARRRKVWVIDDHRADRILTQFAKKLKMLRG